MSTETERAIAAREKKSRAAWDKRSQAASDAAEDALEEREAAEAETGKPKTTKKS